MKWQSVISAILVLGLLSACTLPGLSGQSPPSGPSGSQGSAGPAALGPAQPGAANPDADDPADPGSGAGDSADDRAEPGSAPSGSDESGPGPAESGSAGSGNASSAPAGPLPAEQEPADGGSAPPPRVHPAEQKIGAGAQAALEALRNADLPGLAAIAHPVHGVRFSPYGHVITEGDFAHPVFTADDLLTPGLLGETFYWGVYDGSGEDIMLTFQEFLDQFAYNYDYAAAPEVGWNSVLREGNTILNHSTVYPDSLFVDYHWPGSVEYSGMDWGTLRLVFAEHDGVWYLVAVIHDQWTI